MSSRRYCCVAGCDNSRSNTNYSFFSLPVNVERRKRWLEIIGRDDLLERSDLKSKSHEMCCVHFDQSMVTFVKKLRPHAVPNLAVPRPPGPTDFKDFGDGHLSETSSSYEDQLDEIEGKVNTKPGYRPRGKRPIKSVNEDTDLKYEVDIDLDPPDQVKTDPAPHKSSIVKLRNVGVEFVIHEEVAPEPTADDVKDEPPAPTAVPADPLSILIPDMICDKTIKQEPDLVDHTEETPIFCSAGRPPQNCTKTDCLCDILDQDIKSKLNTLFKWKTEVNKMTKQEFIQFAFNLRISKPGVYIALKSSLQLPDDKILRRVNIHVSTRLDQTMTGLIRAKVASAGDAARYCVVSVGRVRVTPQLYYMIDLDEVVGLRDVHGAVDRDLAQYAYMAVVQGVASDWWLPVSLALVARPPHSLHSWLDTLLFELHGLGLHVKAVVTPPTPHFYRYALSQGVTAQRPLVSCRSSHYHYVFDLCPLLDRLARDLQVTEYRLDEETVSWDYIKSLCSLSAGFNLFSANTTSKLRTALDRGTISRNAGATVNYVETISKVAEILGNDRPLILSKRTKDVLKSAKKMLSKLKPVAGPEEDNPKASSRLIMMSITIEALLRVYKDLKSEKVRIVSGQISRGPVCEVIKTVRSRRGRVVAPSPRWVLRGLRRHLMRALLSSPPEDQTSALLEQWSAQEMPVQIPGRGPLSLSDARHRVHIPERARVRHMAGFLISRCAEVHSECEEFRDIVARLSPLGPWRSPPKSFVEYVSRLEAVCSELVVRGGGGLGARLRQAGRAVSAQFVAPCKCFPLEEMLVEFLRLRIFLYCTETNTRIRRARSSAT